MPLKYRLETGIEVKTVPGFVPELYVIEACHAANHQYHSSWQALSYEEQAELVAAHLLHQLIESHVHDAQQEDLSRKKK